ncbi:MAG: ABC transporter ATP-binding protein [Eubacteriales bacterium]
MAFIELKQVSFFYPGKKEPVLNSVSHSFGKDGITAVVGPNGSGKTTLTKIMVGIVQPNSGEVFLDSLPLKKYSLAEIGRRIGYVFQNTSHQFFCATVAEEIGFGLKHLGKESEAVEEKVEFYLEYFELTAYRNVFPLRLSYGEKQRVAIAAVLANSPDYCILDEPTVGLDVYRKRLLENHLKKIVRLGSGLLIVSHDYNFVKRIADRVVRMENGQVQEGSG